MDDRNILDEAAARISLAVDPLRSMKRSARDPRDPPVWPLAKLNGRAPMILAPTGAKPRGVDLAYARNDPSDLLKKYPPGSANGTATHFMPTSMPAFCVGDGEVTYAGRIAQGFALVVDHGNGWATHYANLEHMFVRPTERNLQRPRTHLKSGDVVGYIGALMPGGFKCLHFELWRRDEDRQFVDVDPTNFMTDWRVLPWEQKHLTVERAQVMVAA